MSNDKTTLADVQPGGRVRLGDQAERARAILADAYEQDGNDAAARSVREDDLMYESKIAVNAIIAALSAQPSPGGQGEVCVPLPTPGIGEWSDGWNACREATLRGEGEALAARQPEGSEEAHILPPLANERMLDAGWPYGEVINGKFDRQGAYADLLSAAPPVGLLQTFQAGVAEWMGQCFLPSLYSNITERGDRLLEEVLELLQAHGYDSARVPTLVDYVFGRPVGEPAQEVGGVMVTLASYCLVAGIDMHAAGDAELARINQPDVMAKIRAKQDAKNALQFDTPLPGNAGAAVEEWPREGDLVRYGTGASALAIRLGPHAGGWHGYQCCGGYTFFTKTYRPSRADMDTWLDYAKYRDERTKVADNRVAHEMYLLDSQGVGNG